MLERRRPTIPPPQAGLGISACAFLRSWPPEGGSAIHTSGVHSHGDRISVKHHSDLDRQASADSWAAQLFPFGLVSVSLTKPDSLCDARAVSQGRTHEARRREPFSAARPLR